MKGLPGFRDFYPEPIPTADSWSLDLRRYIFDTWRGTAERYGFREYDGPPIEDLELYTKKSGDEIVGQLYNFTDKGERNVSLRPEMTPTLARMAASHTRNYKKPLKWFSIPQLFRYERQQKGRLREHFQLNADIIGEENWAADAELIALLIDTLRDLKLTSDDFVVRLSSRSAWQGFFENGGGQEKDAYAFYQIVDKLDREDPVVSGNKLAKLGFSLEQVNDFIESGQPTDELAAIIGNIEARGLGDFIKIDYRIIRGLAYYTGPVYEAFDKRGKFRAIAGGGRYDHLVKLVSGGKSDLPALGFGMGDVVLAELLKDRGLVPRLAKRSTPTCRSTTSRCATHRLTSYSNSAKAASPPSTPCSKPSRTSNSSAPLSLKPSGSSPCRTPTKPQSKTSKPARSRPVRPPESQQN